MTPTWKNHLLRFLQGALIGTGAILPGISGGVLCVAFGIYESMMAFLSHPRSSFKSNYKILLPVIAGGAVGFILLAKVVESLLAASAVLAISLFCGLICGTVPDLMKKSAAAGAEKGWSFFIIALIASFTFFHILGSGMEGHISPDFGWYIFCGVIWGLSMIVPGLSSSSILAVHGPLSAHGRRYWKYRFRRPDSHDARFYSNGSCLRKDHEQAYPAALRSTIKIYFRICGIFCTHDSTHLVFRHTAADLRYTVLRDRFHSRPHDGCPPSRGVIQYV